MTGPWSYILFTFSQIHCSFKIFHQSMRSVLASDSNAINRLACSTVYILKKSSAYLSLLFRIYLSLLLRIYSSLLFRRAAKGCLLRNLSLKQIAAVREKHHWTAVSNEERMDSEHAAKMREMTCTYWGSSEWDKRLSEEKESGKP